MVLTQHIQICFVFSSDGNKKVNKKLNRSLSLWLLIFSLVSDRRWLDWLWGTVLTRRVWGQPSFLHNKVCSHRQTSYVAQTGDICLRSVSLWMLTSAHCKNFIVFVKYFVYSDPSILLFHRSLKEEKMEEKGYSIHWDQVGSPVPGLLSEKQGKDCDL